MEFKGTPALWRWELNEQSKNIKLVGGVPKYDLIVMDFVRYGMNGACPRFNVTHEQGFQVMHRADEMGTVVKGREHHGHWFKNISHPDATLIAHAPEMLEMLAKIEPMLRERHLYGTACDVRDLLTRATTI